MRMDPDNFNLNPIDIVEDIIHSKKWTFSRAADLYGARRKSGGPETLAFSTAASLLGARPKSSDPHALAFSTASNLCGTRRKSSHSEAAYIDKRDFWRLRSRSA